MTHLQGGHWHHSLHASALVETVLTARLAPKVVLGIVGLRTEFQQRVVGNNLKVCRTLVMIRFLRLALLLADGPVVLS